MKIHILIGVSVALVTVGVFVYLRSGVVRDVPIAAIPTPVAEGTPLSVTLSGTFLCLPHTDSTVPQTEECAFGIQTDEGINYAVNFGQSAESMQLFQDKARITAEGFVVPKEALSTDRWNRYNMKGIFTITKMLDSSSASQKLDITAVCQGALAYMTFVDGATADKYVAECIEGKHPEVIEQYKKTMGNEGAI